MSYRLFFSDLTFYFIIYFQWTFHYDDYIIVQAILDWNNMDSNVSYKIDSNYHFSLSKSIKGQMQLGVFHEIISLCHKVSYSFIYLEEYASHVTNRICPKLEL